MNLSLRCIVTSLLLLGLVAAVPSPAAAVPDQINVQGVLRDAAGNLMTGETTLAFRIYGDPGAQELLWEEMLNLPLSGGLFNVYLPSDPDDNPFPGDLFGKGELRWIGIQPNGQEELAALPLVSVPYAMHAGTALLANGLDCSGCIQGGMLSEELLADFAGMATYDNTGTVLTSENLQDAVTELSELLGGLSPLASSGSWLDVADTPADLMDGDGDTLAFLECYPDQIAKWDGVAWGCAPDQDTTYTGANFAASNQSCGPLDKVGGVGPDGSLLCSPDIDTKLSEAEVDAYAGNNGYATFWLLANVATSGKFKDLLDIPVGLLDGDNDVVGALSCSQGQVPEWNGQAWACAADDDTKYTGANFALSNQQCGDTKKVTGLALDGTVICGADIDTKLSEAQVDAYANNNGYAIAKDLPLLAFTASWWDLKDVPEDIADGDADTVAGLNCEKDFVPKWTGSAWTCSKDQDTLYGGANFAKSNQGCTGTDKVVGVDELGDLKCAKDGMLSEADVDAFAGNNGYAVAADLAKVASTGLFADLKNIPAGLADGDGDVLGALTCQNFQIPKWDGTKWACNSDNDHQYSGSNFATSNQACTGSNKVQAISGQGAIVCGADQTGATICNGTNTYLDGEGNCDTGYLDADGQDAVNDAVDSSELDNLCNVSGRILKRGAATWACATETTYSAGTGISITGTTIALNTATTDARYWSRTGNAGTVPGTDFVGTTDNKAFELHVNNARALRLEPTVGIPNVVGGSALNVVTSGVVGATIAGGGGMNLVHDDYGTIGGGSMNVAGNLANQTTVDVNATVGGGYGNTASGESSVVVGGASNTASGDFSMIAGGESNEADGDYSFAAGRMATASKDGCFVWGDSSNEAITCNNDDRFLARASGGVYFYTNSSLGAGAYLPSGSGSWTALSDRAGKDDIAAVDGDDVLAKVAAMPMWTWRYKDEAESIRHLGPMAQDFHAAFGLGDSDRHIASIDADGVALAAVQGLVRKIKAQEVRIASLERANEELAGRLDRLERSPLAAAGDGDGFGYGWALFGGLAIVFGAVQARRARRPKA
jgi:hypothetical protein